MRKSSLNHVYRLVWNSAKGCWQAVTELAKGKVKGRTVGVVAALNNRGQTPIAFAGMTKTNNWGLSPIILVASLMCGNAYADGILPTGGQVVAGQASIAQSGAVMNVTQGTHHAAIDWQSFSIGAGNTVNFYQPSSSAIILNRVIGSDVSSIQGAINANGNVFLINPNGVVFTKTAQVNVGGIVASTRDISNADFMAGRYVLSGDSAASVENHGHITAAEGGAIALVAAKVINTGSLTAHKGQIGLAAGNTVTVDIGGPVLLQVSQGALNAAIEQSGSLNADGGRILLTAKAANNLAASVINQTGIVQARSMDDLLGNVKVKADIVNHSGSTDVSSAKGKGGDIAIEAGLLMDSGRLNANGAQGGSITTQTGEHLQTSSAYASADGTDGIGGLLRYLASLTEGGKAYLSGRNSATGSTRGGQLDATANNLTLAGASVDTSGAQAGKIRLGGGWQGKETDLGNAQNTTVNSLTTLTNTGSGGTVVVWSDVLTNFAGTLSAPGSKVEISGKETLNAALENVRAASVLLDPKNITISESGVTSDAVVTATFATNPTANSIITPASIIALLNAGTAVTLQANNDITVTNAVSANAGSTAAFTLEAGRNVNLNASINTGNGNFTAIAGSSNADVVGANTEAGNPTITIANGVSINAGTGTIELVAQKNIPGAVGKLVNNSGSATPFTATLTRIYLPSFNDLSGTALTTAAKRYNTLFSATGPTSTTASLTGLTSGVNLFYSLAPTLSVTPTSGQSGTYGGTHAPTGNTVETSGLVNGDTLTDAGIGGTATFNTLDGTKSTSNNLVAGVYNVEYLSGLTSTLGYSFADNTEQVGEFTITKKQVTTIQNIFASTKGYDGTTNATIQAFAGQNPFIAQADGRIAGDEVTVIPANLTAQFASKDAGVRKVTITGGTLGGADGGNYSVVGITNGGSLQENINQKTLTLAAAPTIANKVYDGTNTASVTLNGAVTGFIAGETATVTATGAFASKDVGNGITVSLTPVFSDATGGALASNYKLPVGSGRGSVFKANITPKELTVTGSTVADKVYDGLTAATVTVGTLAGLVEGETLGTTTAAGTFASKNASDTAQDVTAVYTLANGTNAAHKASNYVLANQTLTGKINRKALTMTGSTVANKTYDGNRTATMTVGTLAGLVEGETLGTTTATGLFADADAANNKDVAVSYTLASLDANGGGLASNYSLAGQTLKADISKKALTINGTSVANKTYDGLTAAQVTVGTLQGLVGDETLGTTTATGNFVDKDAANGKNVTVAYTLVNGTGEKGAAKASNYSLANETKTANIDKKAITAITGITASNKTYDGNTVAALSTATAGFEGLLANETLTVATATGNFVDKNAAVGKTVNITGLTLGGTDAANYSLTSNTATTKADIAQKQLTISGTTVANKSADGNTTATVTAGTLGGVVQGDNLRVTATGTFADTLPNQGKSVTVEYQIAGLDGTRIENYLAPVKETLTANINSNAALDAVRTVTTTTTGTQTTAPTPESQTRDLPPQPQAPINSDLDYGSDEGQGEVEQTDYTFITPRQPRTLNNQITVENHGIYYPDVPQRPSNTQRSTPVENSQTPSANQPRSQRERRQRRQRGQRGVETT